MELLALTVPDRTGTGTVVKLQQLETRQSVGFFKSRNDFEAYIQKQHLKCVKNEVPEIQTPSAFSTIIRREIYKRFDAS